MTVQSRGARERLTRRAQRASTSSNGDGVVGIGHRGVYGSSGTYQGVSGFSDSNAGVAGESNKFHAIYGVSHDPNNAGVMGISDGGGWGVSGYSNSNTGVAGESPTGVDVHGKSQFGDGVVGVGHRGVYGWSDTFQGVSGFSNSNAGVAGESNKFHAIYGISHDPNNAGVIGINDGGGWGLSGYSTTNTGVTGESPTGVGVHGKGGRLAGFFEGPVLVQGNITVGVGFDVILSGADCAEHFDVADPSSIVPGMVLVIGGDGSLEPSSQPYDTRVAGVVSGAGDFRPGVLLDSQPDKPNRRPLALVGKAYCLVDASENPICAGDLLVTSSTPGHAMTAADATRTPGTIIGKALRPLASGRGTIPILIALQ
jgi:hypothetical protein